MVIDNQIGGSMLYRTYDELTEKERMELRSLRNQVSFCLKGEEKKNRVAIHLALYLMYKYGNTNDCVSYKEIFDEENYDIKAILDEYFNENIWNELCSRGNQFSAEAFFNASFMPEDYDPMNGNFNTPSSIIKLANRILSVEDGETVAEFCCNKGDFLISNCFAEKKCKYIGYDLSTESCAIAKIKSALLDHSFKIVQKNVLDLDFEFEHDKVFSDFPLGFRLNKYNKDNMITEYNKLFGTDFTNMSDSWLFVLSVLSTLSKKGRAACIMVNGPLSNAIDNKIREFLIKNNYIEAIVALPAMMFDYTGISSALIVLNKYKSDEKVKFVDASKLYVKGRRQNVFSKENVDEIINIYENESQYSKFIEYERLVEENYSLNIKRYLKEEVKFENLTKIDDVLISVRRGATYSAAQLDQISSTEETKYQYLMLGNIKNGMIDDNLPYITEINKKYEKFCLNHHNIVISKNGKPFKVAVVENLDERKILANGNLYILELDEEKINPYYLKAYFESEYGSAALNAIAIGSTIPNIPLKDLKELKIPCPALEEQEKIALKYAALEDEIRMLNIKLERAYSKLKEVFISESED
ncbi:N-6 DNA methylase [Floccifex porci]|uniref:site-specific DNA-methyltransferase (adenine-specific) n=1 Tax=Floccifex porci TaxID=2606629 RepID=A0A7X2T2P9_9FIRM|nr:N-6 DNA methylase [Floccifex porci]MSS00602.1 N-6 DNA methylase [Floccifex porci]